MTVRQQQFFDSHALLSYRGQDFLHVSTRINHYSMTCLFTPQQSAVLLKRGNGDDSNFH
jgi:hypothetical protein